MVINTSNIIPLSQVNRDFNKITHIVEYQGYAVILKHNIPKFLVLGFDNLAESLELLDIRLQHKEVCTKIPPL